MQFFLLLLKFQKREQKLKTIVRTKRNWILEYQKHPQSNKF